MAQTRKFIVFGLMAVGYAGFIEATQADTVNLVGGWNVNWDVNAHPTKSPNVAIQIQNAAASSDPIFNAYDLGLKFLLVSGSGQIALDTASNPSSDSIIPSWENPSPVMGLDSGTYTMLNFAYDDSDFGIPDTPTDLVSADFKPGAISPVLGSVFEVFSDHNYSDYVDHLGHSTNYANNASGDFLLGTITVTPEPSSLALLGVAAVGIAIHFARRKRCSSGLR